MSDDDGTFGTDELRRAALATATMLDLMEDEDIQEAVLNLRYATTALRDLYIQNGIDPHIAALSVNGAVLGALLPPAED